MVAGRVVLLFVALRQALSRHGGHDSGHVDVGQPVGEFVNVHVDAVDAVLGINLAFESRFSSSVKGFVSKNE